MRPVSAPCSRQPGAQPTTLTTSRDALFHQYVGHTVRHDELEVRDAWEC